MPREERLALWEKLKEFDALSRAEQIGHPVPRRADRAAPPSDQANYWSVLRRYHHWVQGLTEDQRNELNAAPARRTDDAGRPSSAPRSGRARTRARPPVSPGHRLQPRCRRSRRRHRLKVWFELSPEKRAEIETIARPAEPAEASGRARSARQDRAAQRVDQVGGGRAAGEDRRESPVEELADQPAQEGRPDQERESRSGGSPPITTSSRIPPGGRAEQPDAVRGGVAALVSRSSSITSRPRRRGAGSRSSTAWSSPPARRCPPRARRRPRRNTPPRRAADRPRTRSPAARPALILQVERRGTSAAAGSTWRATTCSGCAGPWPRPSGAGARSSRTRWSARWSSATAGSSGSATTRGSAARTPRSSRWPAAGERPRGATLYVTLEPCCHHGKTPPCTDAILAAGIARVVAAMRDPFPKVAGGGLARLRGGGRRRSRSGCSRPSGPAARTPRISSGWRPAGPTSRPSGR